MRFFTPGREDSIDLSKLAQVSFKISHVSAQSIKLSLPLWRGAPQRQADSSQVGIGADMAPFPDRWVCSQSAEVGAEGGGRSYKYPGFLWGESNHTASTKL